MSFVNSIPGRSVALVFALSLAVVGTACTPGPNRSGFLKDYSALRPDPEIEGAFSYVKDEGVLRDYDKIVLDPVVVFYDERADNRMISPDVLKELTDYLYQAIEDAVGDAYPVVEDPGPGVLRARAAITGVRPLPRAVPLRGSPNTFIQDKLRASAATAFSPIETAMEAELLDSVTGERLAAFADRRVGGASPPPERTRAWEQVAAALDFWASRLRLALDRSRSGT